jgi:hypothetical protein
MLVDFWMAQDRMVRPEVILAPLTQDEPVGLDQGRFSERRLPGSRIKSGMTAHAVTFCRA